ncbi:hypothetical protein Vretifemale_10178, partial [Volvox reticuliferus]
LHDCAVKWLPAGTFRSTSDTYTTYYKFSTEVTVPLQKATSSWLANENLLGFVIIITEHVLRKNKRAAKYNSGGREDGASDRSASELGDCHHGAKEALAEGVPKDAEDLEDQAFRKAAAKRAHADELLARLSKKFCTTLNGKKKLALQDKMMRLLPKCSPMQPEPKVLGSLPTRTNTARGVTVATSLQSSIRTSHLGTGFPLKLIRTPKAATHVLTEPSSAQEDARLRLRQHRFGDSSAAAAQEGSPKARSVRPGVRVAPCLQLWHVGPSAAVCILPRP